ncbi:thiolase family protein [Plantactinospora sp. GCM10030261]|uniref:thiolase family protein n=1 Tax=Plantactinospora sp. GCM10030261 TaxID=3273420 RepID=UPI00361AC5DE
MTAALVRTARRRRHPLAQARVVGVGTTEQARDLSHRSGMSLALEALRLAADDSGIDIAEIDGISSVVSGYPYGADDENLQLSQEMYWMRQLGHPLRWIAPQRGIPAILDAAIAIDRGLASTVAIVVGMSRPADSTNTAAWSRPANEFTGWTGSFTAVQFALAGQRYLHEYGDKALHAMARSSATIRNYGHLNPAAVYYGRGPFTARDVLDSRPIATPLTLLMCSTVNDGGCALIVTGRERARDTRKRPISIIAGGDQQPYTPYVEAPVLDGVPDEGAFARAAMDRAGITLDDIDVVELYDHFAIGVLMEFEMFGFCGRGEAADFVESGVMELDGRYPTCTDGGNQAYSHNGFPAIFRPIEAVRQLRREVVDPCTADGTGRHYHTPGECRAVRDPKLAFVTNPGPPTGGASFMVLGRD